jgi:hypothetical protein
MANSTASIVIKPTAAFSCGDTFVFGSWIIPVLPHMTPDLETGLVMLPEVVTSPLIEKFGELSLYNQVSDFEIGSDSISNLKSPWIKACELAPEPSCEMIPLNKNFPYGLCNSGRGAT